jgi:galactokinase
MSDFASHFGRPAAVQAEAPGRVNLIGEHTDYNGGFVLPTVIPQRTAVALAPRADGRVRAVSGNVAGPAAEFALGQERPGGTWADYVAGAAAVLRQEGMALGGFDVFLTSTVPLGSGLSSSAALLVALLRALRSAFGLAYDDVRLAQLAQRVENSFVGAQVGIMDPLVCSLGQPGSALFVDARSLAWERVPLPAGAELVVINSGLAHQHAAGDYNTRRAECERACALLGVAQLRDLSAADLPRVAALPEPLNRRARHVITENDRVLATVAAFRGGDLAEAGRLFTASHRSQSSDYAVSIPEIDTLVAEALQEEAVYGARLTGGGFGGSVVLLARAGAGREVGERVSRRYAAATGQRPTVLVP